MKESWKKWLEKKGIKKWFQRDNLIILVLSGILLFIIAMPVKETDSQDNAEKNNLFSQNESVSKTTDLQQRSEEIVQDNSLEIFEEIAYENTQTQYAAYLEQKLKNTLIGMEGVGEVKVMITLKSSEELVVEKDEPVNRQNTTEEDSQGGSRTVMQVESGESTVYTQSGDISSPYVVKTLFPEVEGVVVVAEGAGNGTVNQSITEVVQALFDIEAHKVKVVKMQSSNK